MNIPKVAQDLTLKDHKEALTFEAVWGHRLVEILTTEFYSLSGNSVNYALIIQQLSTVGNLLNMWDMNTIDVC